MWRWVLVGYDSFDLPLERFCLSTHDDTLMTAKARPPAYRLPSLAPLQLTRAAASCLCMNGGWAGDGG